MTCHSRQNIALHWRRWRSVSAGDPWSPGSGMRWPTSKETKTNATCLYVIYYTNMLFSIFGVAVWNPDIDLYKRYIIYRISFNITTERFAKWWIWFSAQFSIKRKQADLFSAWAYTTVLFGISDVSHDWFSTCSAASCDVSSVRFTCETSRYVSCDSDNSNRVC